MFSYRFIVVSAVLLGVAPWLQANVTLPAIISNHMVLQKAARVPIWGKAAPAEQVTVSVAGKSGQATADASGKWMLYLDLADAAQGPFEMKVTGNNSLTISDVVIGEVWVAGGQSNMVFSLANAIDAAEELPRAANPLLRQFRMERVTSDTPLEDFKGVWQPATQQAAAGFSAVGYYFAKALQSNLKVPVGFISTNWGGTPIESWMSSEALDGAPDLKEGKENNLARRAEYVRQSREFGESFLNWLKSTKREDHPVADVTPFTSADGPTEGWTSLSLPGPLTGAGLPETGAIWLRKEITVPDNLAGRPLRVDLGSFDGFDTAYWNGKQVHTTTVSNYLGEGAHHLYDIQSAQMKAGKNILAIRIYAPVAMPKIAAAPKTLTLNLDKEWQVKAEYELSPLNSAQQAAAPQAPKGSDEPQKVSSSLFNGMINPLVPYGIRGALWYQGEANAARAYQYRTALPLLITDWRQRWGQGDFPFYICQLANFMAKKPQPAESAWAELREAQFLATKLPNTFCAILIDLGESGDIHPRHKREAGERLARIALARDYHIDQPFEGPTYVSSTVEGGKVRVKLAHAEGGLTAAPLPETYIVRSIAQETAPLTRNSPASEVEGFAICGDDKNWVWADAKIEGDSVVVWSNNVPAPIAVRYAWSDNPTCNLTNGAGLPTVPFRTDDFPAFTENQKY